MDDAITFTIWGVVLTAVVLSVVLFGVVLVSTLVMFILVLLGKIKSEEGLSPYASLDTQHFKPGLHKLEVLRIASQ